MAAKLPLLNPRPGRPASIEIVPGTKSTPMPSSEVSRFVVAELIPTGEPSTYRAVAKVKDVNLRLTSTLTRQLGLGPRTDTMRRLIKAGFVGGGRIAPGCYIVDIESYFEHVRKVKEAADAGDDFWTAERLTRYRASI